MGGAVSIEPQRTPDILKILSVITNEENMEKLFRKIAIHGKNEEGIRHPYLGQKKDVLCLPEIMLFITKDKDPVFTHMGIERLSIIKEAFYFEVGVHTMHVDELERIALKKELSLLAFFQFMANLFMFARLWQIFAAADDGIEDEFISRDEFCRAKGKLESMGGVVVYREMTDAQWARGFSYMDDSKDEQIEFSEFVHFCVKFIITPEEYLIRAVAVSVTKRESFYSIDENVLKKLLSRHKKSISSDSLGALDEDDTGEESPQQWETTERTYENFDVFLKKVKESKANAVTTYSDIAANIHNEASEKRTSLSSRKGITRAFSDIDSAHGWGPSEEDKVLMKDRSEHDHTKKLLDDWTNNQMSENNKEHFRKWASVKGRRRCVDGSSTDDEQTAAENSNLSKVEKRFHPNSIPKVAQNVGDDCDSEQSSDPWKTERRYSSLDRVYMDSANTVEEQGSMSIQSLHIDDSIPDENFEDDASIDSVISASTLMSHAQEAKAMPSSPFSRYEKEDLTADNMPSVLNSYYPPKKLVPIAKTSGIHAFMKGREIRRQKFYNPDVLNSLSCKSSRSVIKSELTCKSSRSVIKSEMSVSSQHFHEVSRICVSVPHCDTEKDINKKSRTMSRSSMKFIKPGVSGHKKTCTPCDMIAQPEKFDALSLIEKLILSKFEQSQPKSQLCEAPY